MRVLNGEMLDLLQRLRESRRDVLQPCAVRLVVHPSSPQGGLLSSPLLDGRASSPLLDDRASSLPGDLASSPLLGGLASFLPGDRRPGDVRILELGLPRYTTYCSSCGSGRWSGRSSWYNGSSWFGCHWIVLLSYCLGSC